MATKKDLVEAYAFSRRRLVTAFISGAPGGREVEPTRPGRTIIGGVALAVLVIAGGAVTGVFKPRVDGDWKQPGLVASKEKPVNYLILETPEGEEPKLRQSINGTSAQLLFGADVEKTTVPEKELKTLEEGPPIGILGAPATPPAADSLINEGWVACTGADEGIKVTVTEDTVVEPAPTSGFLVTHDGDYYVIGEGVAGPAGAAGAPDVRAYRYPVDLSRRGLSDTTLRALTGSISSQAVEVPLDWLRLFPAGGALDVRTLGLGEIGQAADYPSTSGVPRSARIGDYFEVDGTTFVLGEKRPYPLNAFEEIVVRAQVGPAGAITVDGDPGALSPPATDAHWPTEPLTAPVGQLCAQLTPAEESPLVNLVRPAADADTVSAGEVAGEDIEYDIDSGTGAFVHSAQWDNQPGAGEAYLIDSQGQSFLLQGSEVPGLLGYAEVPVLIAPAPWVKLFVPGVTLSVDAARCPPARVGREPCA